MGAVRESTLLNYVYTGNTALPASVTIPPGDDMGAVRLGEQTLLVTTDQLAAAVHVDIAATPIEKVGRKAMTRSLSDVAAMAAIPTGAVVAVALPDDFGQARAQQLFDAIRQAGNQYNCPVIGGDIAIWPNPLLITVTIFAEAAGIDPVLRRGAKPGHDIYVTGQLGGSLHTVGHYTHHLDFQPRINLARTLAGNPGTRPHAMMDLSDGLAMDLPRLCHAADNPITAEIDLPSLPLSPAAMHAARKSGKPPWQHAVGDGEDYELLFTAPPDAIPATVQNIPITRIGTITARQPQTPPVRWRLEDGRLADTSNLGWEHHGQ